MSSKIKWGKTKKEKGKTPKLLEKKLKAQPQKRKKRGILRKTETGKKPTVVKQVKQRKRVSFGKTGFHKRHEQKEQLYDPDTRYSRAPDVPYTAAQLRERMVGSRGDPKTTFKVDAQGRLVQVARKRRKIQIV